MFPNVTVKLKINLSTSGYTGQINYYYYNCRTKIAFAGSSKKKNYYYYVDKMFKIYDRLHCLNSTQVLIMSTKII